jgi:hypothetical protein
MTVGLLFTDYALFALFVAWVSETVDKFVFLTVVNIIFLL